MGGNQDQQAGNRVGKDFDQFLRTGRSASLPGAIEVKFNPYHDPRNGQFTFAPGGRVDGRNHVASERRAAPGAKSYEPTHPKNAKNYALHVVRAGETLESIAKLRKGITAADLEWLNDLKSGTTLRVGQALKLPHQAFLEAGREAKNKILALEYYIQTHSGRLPPNVAHPPSIAAQISDQARWQHIDKNGYRFAMDAIARTRQINGTLTSNVSQRRSRGAQLRAGGADRLPGDHGGHYIARRFNGPTEAFNHFAQDANFNRGAYQALEKSWDKDRTSGKKVYVQITPFYEGLSQRPSSISVIYWVDGKRTDKVFPNRKGGR